MRVAIELGATAALHSHADQKSGVDDPPIDHGFARAFDNVSKYCSVPMNDEV